MEGKGGRRGHRRAALTSLSGRLGLFAALVGCASEPHAAPTLGIGDAGVADIARAEELLDAGAPLPGRAEVVALTDRLSIEAERHTETPDGAEGAEGAAVERAKLAMLAARLRERLWRFDRSATDAREALELFRRVAALPDPGLACEADRRHAQLSGELGADAVQTYGELYLTRARYQPAKGKAKASDGVAGCLESTERAIAGLEPFRPVGEAWQALEEKAVAAASGRAAAHSAAAGDAGSLETPPSAIEREVVVVPDASLIKNETVLLREAKPYSYERGGRVVLTLSAPVRYEAGMLPPDADAGRGHRVYLDLFGARIKGPKMEMSATGLIQRVRLGKREFGTRVVIDLDDAVFRRIFYLPDPFRVVIDLTTRAPVGTTDGAVGEKRVVRRVTLDPGHGGWDGGAVGPTGVREKDVVLDIAHRAATALASELGIETMLTRDRDVYVPLEDRTARANAFQSDVFVSVHCNATENGQASGIEIYVLDPAREQDKRAMALAHRENYGGRSHGFDPSALDAQVASIASGLNVGSTARGSRVLAELLRKATLASVSRRYTGTVDHGVKTAGFFVLLGADMPATLFETSFVSNPDDEARLATADYRQKMADAIVNGVRAYRDGHK
jgi:N-acetylmuramoyl-L-alanine amidase